MGKSVIFNRLTGLNVSVANYVGTTVELTIGRLKLGEQDVNLVDVPGTYSLQATCEAERVAVELLCSEPGGARKRSGNHCHPDGGLKGVHGKPAAVLCVVDAGNLENSLYLLLQVLQKKLPVIVVLNRSDLASEKGFYADAAALARLLGVPVIPTVAISGIGMEEVKNNLALAVEGKLSLNYQNPGETASWERVAEICRKVWTKKQGGNNTRRRRWGELLTLPWPGLPLALIIIGMIFAVVIGLGLGLRQWILLPFFRILIFPRIEWAVMEAVPPGMLQNILIGEYGFLIKGIEWPFALVLPYVISFYAALSLFEDSGYMPRLGILLDGLLNRVGLQGSGVIPLLLGYGCAIPAILSTRTLNSQKERLIITTMICLAVPCIAQTGSFIALLSVRSIPVMLAVFLLGWLAMVAVALVLNRMVKGDPPEMLLEIPDLLLPRGDVLLKKIWLRIKHFMVDGALPMVIGVGIAAFLYETGLMTALGELMRPLVVSWLGLPAEAAVPLILGILRRELTVLPLLDMDLTTLQLFVGATVGLFYVPCIAVIATLTREYGIRMALAMLLLTTIGAFLLGGIITRLGGLFYG